MFDVTFQPLGLDVQAPDKEQVEAGVPPVLSFLLVAGLGVPVGDPAQGQGMQVPSAQLRFGLPKDVALQFAEAIVEAADKLPDTKQSDLIIPGDPSQVDAFAKQMSGFRNQ